MDLFFLKMNYKNKYLIIFPMLNLLFMHYYFYFSDILEWTWVYSEITNLCGVVFDVSILLIVSLLIVGGRLKPAFAITQMLTLIWSFANVMYGKFFFQYMSLSAFGETHGLGDDLVINSVMSAFCWYDLFYLISAICFILVYRRVKPDRYQYKMILRLFVIPVITVLLTIAVFSTYHFIHPHFRNNWELYKFRVKEFLYDSIQGGTPNLAHFQTGCIRVALFEIYDMLHVTELTSEQRKQIEEYYMDHSRRTTHHQRNPQIKNVIFILLESFLSAPIDLEVDGKEITPFLNSLKRDSDVYYNGNMISDIGCGESGDGQFIYMTGILPLRHKMTVGQVKDNVLPALPKILKSQLGVDCSVIISPTVPNLWQQAEMNAAYEFDKAYWRDDIIGNQMAPFDDKMIFEFASQKLDTLNQPFFSLLLSLTTHGPYNKFVGDDILKDNRTLTKEYCNYLNSCHYLDAQIGKYIATLKDKGIYDNSLILIASDHYAHLDMLNMTGKITSNTPLFIINGNIDENSSWKGEFHQLDLYTTLLDILDINMNWKGLGYTLLSPLYMNSVDTKASQLSDLIIEGDYFAR